MEQLIPRRAFLKFMIVAAGAMGLPNWSLVQKTKRNHDFSFYVAGVRFNSSSEHPNVGSCVRIVPEMWNQQQSYAIHSESGQRIGYLPRKMIPSLQGLTGRQWQVASVNLNGLPWKRYKIALSS